MVAALLALGYPKPDISEVEGPYVRVALLGGKPDVDWVTFLALCVPQTVAQDVETLLLLDELVTNGWIDVASTQPVLQRSALETRGAIDRLQGVTYEGSPLIVNVAGNRPSELAAWRL